MTSKIVVNNIESSNSDLTLDSASDLTLASAATNDVKIKSRNVTYTMPTADGTNGQFMKTDGSGNLGFATVDTSVDQTSLKNTVSLPGTTYNSLKLIRVWDFHNNLPPSNMQVIYASSSNPSNANTGMYVPTSMASTTDKITKFVIKFDNLNWAYNA